MKSQSSKFWDGEGSLVHPHSLFSSSEKEISLPPISFSREKIHPLSLSLFSATVIRSFEKETLPLPTLIFLLRLRHSKSVLVLSVKFPQEEAPFPR